MTCTFTTPFLYFDYVLVLITYFFLIAIDTCEGLISYFYLIIWYSTGPCLGYYYYKEAIGVYNPLFSQTFHSIFWDSTSCSINIESTWIFKQLAVLEFCNMKWFLHSCSHSKLIWTFHPSTNLVFSSQILQFSRFNSQHSKLYQSFITCELVST